jgi:ribose transport system permease protein
MSTEPAAEPRTGGGAAPAPRERGLLSDLHLSRFTGLFLWAAIILIFAIAIPGTFLTGATAKSIASDQSVTGIVAMAVLIPLACGLFDISAAQMVGTSSIFAGSLMTKSGMSPAEVVVLTLLLGVLVGSINGFIVAVIGVDSLIATLGMSSILIAVSGYVSEYQFIGPFPSDFKDIVAGTVLGIPTITVYLIAIAVLLWYVLEHTPAGRRLFATGASPEAARLAGVRTSRLKFASLVASSVLATVAGLLLAAKIGQVAPTVGPEYLLPGFAACFLGTTQFRLGRFIVPGTLLALFLLATGVTGLQQICGELWITALFNGVALIVAVSASLLAARRKARRMQQNTANEGTP